MNNIRIEFAWNLLEIESLIMNARAMLGQGNLTEFIIKTTQAEAKLNEMNELIRTKPESEYFLATDEAKEMDIK